MTWLRWYKILEVLSQLIFFSFLILLTYRFIEAHGDVNFALLINVFVPQLFIPFLFLPLSMFFRYLDSDRSHLVPMSGNSSPFIGNIRDMFDALGIQGVQFGVLLFFLGSLAVGGFEHSTDVLNVSKYVFGAFVGMGFEKRLSKRAIPVIESTASPTVSSSP